ncbi:EamA-like transporter family [Candidatus Ornithobacterium hominis]|uniref:EamA family transporter n=1 Tax=Candidatus Ornithobacterium hominis TaxID=2497989 RepID=UPI0024BCBCAD|nr:EamA/RhaT family transporter [Candidatus Ornithobacterium hominis]CAI9429052.1 EamA-like transporter family [Candidatus Ornithobacterium hominis]
MGFLLASIVASVLVSILLKLARKKHVNIAQAVAINYPIATICSLLFLKPDFSDFKFQSGGIYFILLGVLLPIVFVIMGKAIQQQGIIKADAAQRISLVIGLIFSFFIWKEDLASQKILGVFLAFSALIFLLLKSGKQQSKKNSWWLLLLVWLGYGSTDVLFKLISQTTNNDFAITLTFGFILAGILIFSYLCLNKVNFKRSSIIAGFILGLLNFANIFSYIKAHQVLHENPSLVFTGMNIGVIALATLLGLFIFKEKISHWNYLGIGLAILAIIVLFLPL